jgi:hypothetical protein
VLSQQIQELTAVLCKVVSTVHLKSYDNPIRRLLFLQVAFQLLLLFDGWVSHGVSVGQSEDVVEESYREFRGVTVDLRLLPSSTLPEDIVSAELAQPIASVTLHIDVAVARTDPPCQCTHTFVVDGVDTGVFVRLDVNCRRGSGALFVRGCDGSMDTIPLSVEFSCVSLPNGCIVAEGVETVSRQRGGDGPHTVTIPCKLRDTVESVQLSVQGCFVFGSGAASS